MIAFWSYDRYPYCLSSPVKKENDDGTVTVTRYGGARFRPIAILTDSDGLLVAETLESLQTEYERECRKLHEDYMNKAKSIASFIK